ncbi:hypothetical protein D3C71_1956420 [compost metagenome]
MGNSIYVKGKCAPNAAHDHTALQFIEHFHSGWQAERGDSTCGILQYFRINPTRSDYNHWTK